MHLCPGLLLSESIYPDLHWHVEPLIVSIQCEFLLHVFGSQSVITKNEINITFCSDERRGIYCVLVMSII